MVLHLGLYICASLLLLCLLWIYWRLIYRKKRIYDALHCQGVPGEPFVPILGQISQIQRYRKDDRMMIYHEELTEKHGRFFLLGFGPLIHLFVNEPDFLAYIFSRSHAQNYIKPPYLTAFVKPILGSNNLLVNEGQAHERARKMLNPAFHFLSLKSMISIITQQTTKAIDELLESMSISQQPVNLQTIFSTLTLSIIASSAFGESFETITNAKEIVCRAFTEVFDALEYRAMHMINFIPLVNKLPFWRKNIVDNGSREVAHFVDQVIARRRNGQSTSVCAGADLLDLLLSAEDAEGQSFTDEEIKQQALTFVFAGHETTGNLMTWLMYVLMTHDDVLRACQEEIDRVLPDGIEPTSEHISDLIICEAVLQETLRLYPPVPLIPRQCTREHTIGSSDRQQLRIPVGTIIAVNTWILHRQAEYWPRPLEFDYSRWLRDADTGLKPKLAHPFCYLPFAAGPRTCIGQSFALLEGKIILAMFLQRCRFDIEPGQTITPDIHITMRPKYGVLARISKRQ